MSVVHVNPTNVPDFSGKCIIKFSATWCGPCKAIAPHFESLAKKTPSISFFHVDVDENTLLSEKYKVTAMPTFIFLNDKKEVDRLLGADKVKLENLVNELFKI